MTKASHAWLLTYLDDHLGGAQSAVAMVERFSSHFAGQPLGAFFASLGRDIRADHDTLKAFAVRLGGPAEGAAKEALGRASEFLGRVKTPLATTSEPFSLFEALEILALGILGKRSLWRAIGVARSIPEAAGAALNLPALIARAEEQFERVEAERLRAAARVL